MWRVVDRAARLVALSVLGYLLVTIASTFFTQLLPTLLPGSSLNSTIREAHLKRDEDL